MSISAAPTGFLSLGQTPARRAVMRAASGGRLQRTLLVHGPRGAGKGAFVADLLALLFCNDATPDRRPCNGCRACRDARALAHPDLVVGSPELWRASRGAGESIVSAARRWLLESAGTPIAADRRVILIEGLDRASEQIQNALLKALEEPGPRQMFVLVADDAARVLPTIRSRAQPMRVGAAPRAELVAWLMDRERLPADQADVLVRMADGLPGRAIGYARNPEAVAWRRRTQDELLALLRRPPADRFASARELLDQARAPVPAERDDGTEGGEEPTARTVGAAQRAAALMLLDAWEDLARDLLLTSLGRADMAPTAQLLTGLVAAGQELDVADLLAFLRLVGRAREGLTQNAAPRLTLEVAMLSWPRLGAETARAG